MSVHHHRSALKQSNKPFKSKHATKSSLKEAAKGRVPTQQRQSLKSTQAASVTSSAQNKLNRKNHAKQIQLAKRQSLVDATRIFSGVDGAPRIVAVLPLTEDVSAKSIVERFVQNLEVDGSSCPDYGVWKIRADRFRSTLQFILLPYGQFYTALDATKAADYLLLGLSTATEVDSQGETILRCLQAQGMPQTVAIAQDPTSLDKRTDATTLKSLLSFTKYFVPSLTRVFDLASSSDVGNTLRSLCEGKPADVRWREGRSWLVAEDATLGQEDGNSVLKVTGVVRGAAMSADRLVHLPGWGDFRVAKIWNAPIATRTGMDIEIQVISEPTELADDLVSTNDPDEMANEQTWPTEEEMNGSSHPALPNSASLPNAKPGTTPKAIKKVPKGTSAYQAAWLLDDEEDEGDDEDWSDVSDEDGIEGGVAEDDAASLKASTKGAVADEEEMELLTEEPSSKAVRFEDMDMEEEKRQLNNWRAERAKEHATHTQFPDEIDTPMDIPARERFARYRGLKSFRTSPWDPNENLPLDYAKIFKVENKEWEIASRRVKDAPGVMPGTRVTIDVVGVPAEVLEEFKNSHGAFTLFGLHKHEHKKTVVNFTIQRNTEYEEPVRSKDALTLCIGPRRYITRPIYSQHLRGGSKTVNNVHKFERYLQHGVVSVGTAYAPLNLGRLPVMLLKEGSNPEEIPTLVGSGTLLPPSSARIIAKRIILTGHPFKIHKKTATIRYMFFNPQDVLYFKPVQLSTKYGRTGNIVESLGTHGYFKAHFDGSVTQMDTVCMNLYKRVYPKWVEPWKSRTVSATGGEQEAMEE